MYEGCISILILTFLLRSSCGYVACLVYHVIQNFQECNLEEVSEEDEGSSKSLKDKKANGPDGGKGPSLLFKLTSRVQYKTVLKGGAFLHSL